METKIFKKKKIKIRELSRRDSKKVKEFQDFINSLIEEEAQILGNKKLSLKEERKWLQEKLTKIKNHKEVLLIAESNNKIVGSAGINLDRGRKSHIGYFVINIRKNYRGIGLGSYLTEKILKLAKEKLRPRPKIITLAVFSTNQIAISFYKKFGFKKVARIPEQFEYKGKLIDEIIMIRYL